VPAPVDVLVAVPARNEERRIEGCLRAVLLAARRGRPAARTHVVLGAHRCTDSTAATAQRLFRSAPDVPGLVVVDARSETVGGVRAAAIAAGLAAGRLDADRADPAQTWIFSTDADSCVPPDWIAATLRQVHESGSVAAVGLVRLESWAADDAAHLAYARILEAGSLPGGHSHVYGANLAVRLDAYLAVGGFEELPHGEDQALVGRLRRAGWPVLTTLHPVVRTSARMPGRAPHGLGDLLQTLADPPDPGAVAS